MLCISATPLGRECEGLPSRRLSKQHVHPQSKKRRQPMLAPAPQEATDLVRNNARQCRAEDGARGHGAHGRMARKGRRRGLGFAGFASRDSRWGAEQAIQTGRTLREREEDRPPAWQTLIEHTRLAWREKGPWGQRGLVLHAVRGYMSADGDGFRRHAARATGARHWEPLPRDR